MPKRASPTVYKMSPKLEELRWFVLTVEHGSAHRASLKVGTKNLATIATSNRRMEQFFNTDLFDPDRKPTQAGMVFYEYAKKVLQAHEKMVKKVKKAATGCNAPRVPGCIEEWLKIAHPSILNQATDFRINRIITYETFADWLSAARSTGPKLLVSANRAAIVNLQREFKYSKVLATLPTFDFTCGDGRRILPAWDMDLMSAQKEDDIIADNPSIMAYTLVGRGGVGRMPQEWVPRELVPLLKKTSEESLGKPIEVVAFYDRRNV